MNKGKRILMFVMTALMMFGVFSMQSQAAEDKGSVASIQVTNTPADVLVVKKDQEYKLKVKVTVTGDVSKKVKYSSADKSIATVSSTGCVKGIKKGTTKVTVKSVENPKVKKTITVTVGSPVTGVAIKKKEIDLTVGDSYQVKTSLSPKSPSYSQLSYSSSNKKIASVSETGAVTALKTGQVTITVKSMDGSNLKDTCVITVKKKTVAVSSVKLNKTSASMEVEAQLALKATISPADATDKTVTWSSSDETVATVSKEGKVTALKVGQVTISAKSSNQKKAACVITVKEKPTINLNRTEISLEPGEEWKINAVVTPIDAPNRTVKWTTSDASLATVDENGNIKALKAGKAIITASALDGKTATCTVNVISDQVDAYFDVPYVSTYYFNPKPSVKDDIQIPLYLTDSEQSEYMKDDKTKKLDLLYEVDGVRKVIKDLPLGDYNLQIGKLSRGMHTFSVQTLDQSTGRASHRLYNDLWVVDPDQDGITDAQTYQVTDADLAKYKIKNNNSTAAADLKSTRDGLTNMFADLAKKYKKCILPKGIYRIDGENARTTCISIPSHFTVDMNGSTFKLNTIKSENEGCIVVMNDVVDAHLINGILEGDRVERQALGLETDEANKAAKGEKINTILINGGKYCSIENLTIKNTTGHTVMKTYVWGKNIYLSGNVGIAVFDGQEIKKDNCWTSTMTDLKDLIDLNPDEPYMYVGHPEGYRGLKGNSPIVYVSFYKENNEYIETITGYQYRKMLIPGEARYARVTMLGTYFPSTSEDYANTVSIYSKRYGDYCEIKNIDFYDTRTTALAPAVCSHLLIEGCTYTRAGNSITPCAVDFEDGAQECQDIFYRNNKVLENSGTMTVIDNYGFNHVYEKCENHSFEIRDRVVGGVIRNMTDGKGKVTWYLGDKMHAAYGRLYDNNCGRVLFKKKTSEPAPVRFKVKNCTIRADWMESLPERVVFENCTFPVFNGGNTTLKNCKIQLGSSIGTDLYCYNCVFQITDGTDGKHGINLDGAINAIRLFEGCKFLGKTTTNVSFRSGVFRACEFEDFDMIAGVSGASREEKILFENCKIKSAADAFIIVGPYDYQKGFLNVEFKDCDITHTGKTFIDVMGKANWDSKIVFDHCTIYKTEGNLLTGYNGYDANLPSDIGTLNIIFRNTEMNRDLKVDDKMNPQYVNISYEN